MKYFFLLAATMLFFVRLASAQTVTHFDTVYTPPGYVDGDHVATIYLPAHPNGAAVVALHEMGATRASMTVWCDSLAANGFVAMTIEYPDPSTNSAVFPSPARALKIATQFLKRSAAKFHINPAYVGAIGRSLGAVVIGGGVISDNDTALYHDDPTIDDHLAAAVALYGLYDFNNYTTSVLPLALLTAAFFQSNAAWEAEGTAVLHAAKVTTPMLLIHGTADVTLQYQQSQEMHDSLDAHHKINTLILYPSQGHVFETSSSTSFSAVGLQVKDSALAYFSKYLLAASDVSNSATTPAEFSLDKNFPNPFSMSTTFSYSLPQDAFVTLEIFNTLGERVATPLRDMRAAGAHREFFNASGLRSGIYFYRITAGNFSREEKMMVVH